MQTKNGSKHRLLALLQRLEQTKRHYFGYSAYKLQLELNNAEGKQPTQDQVEATPVLGGQEGNSQEAKQTRLKRQAYYYGTKVS